MKQPIEFDGEILIVCAWCMRDEWREHVTWTGEVSHGICEHCYEQVTKEKSVKNRKHLVINEK